jgi:tetraacyldisaccharide 4'-kinase
MKRFRERAVRASEALWYGAHPLRWLLWPISQAFRFLVALRRLGYRQGWLRSFDAGVPVIVVGNISVGGTGKTPLVIWLAARLRERGLRVGILCSGYGGKAQRWPQPVAKSSDVSRVGDEALLLARRTLCPVVAGPDRTAGAKLLLRPAPLDVIVADDGLQHYRLKRAFEIAVVDGTRGLGNGFCLPAGPLREPASRLADVDAVVVNAGEFGHRGMLRARLRVSRVYGLGTGVEKPLADFAGRQVHAVAAIGNPERFFDALESEKLVVEPHALPDHADLSEADFAFEDDHPVLITEKDAVKCERFGSDRLWCVVTDLEFSPGHGERLLQNLDRALQLQPENR